MPANPLKSHRGECTLVRRPRWSIRGRDRETKRAADVGSASRNVKHGAAGYGDLNGPRYESNCGGQ